MTSAEIVDLAQHMIGAGRPFLLATVDQQGAPQARWMGGNVLDPPLTLWMASRAKARKMDQLRANPAAQLIFADERFQQVITIAGRGEVVDGLEPKRRLWEAMPVLSQLLSGLDDPNFGVIKFVGSRVELLDLTQGTDPQIAEL